MVSWLFGWSGFIAYQTTSDLVAWQISDERALVVPIIFYILQNPISMPLIKCFPVSLSNSNIFTCAQLNSFKYCYLKLKFRFKISHFLLTF